MKEIDAFFADLVGMISAKDSEGLAGMVEIPYTIIEDEHNHSFQNREELARFLDEMLTRSGGVLAFDPQITSIKPFGGSLFLVEYTLTKVTQALGLSDPRRQLCMIRDTHAGLRAVTSFWGTDTHDLTSPAYSVTQQPEVPQQAHGLERV